MGTGENDSSRDDEGEGGAARSVGTGPEACVAGPLTHKLTHQVIIRHLAKLRDGATVVLNILETHAPEPLSPTEPITAARAPVAPGGLEPSSSLERRISRHMASVGRAIQGIEDFKLDRKKTAELPPAIRQQIATKERTIHDIVAAELHFWAAAIENAPLDRFDEIEQTWVGRIVGLANIIGVDADHQEHLVFLKNWASPKHS